jgi:hypothetical protein
MIFSPIARSAGFRPLLLQQTGGRRRFRWTLTLTCPRFQPIPQFKCVHMLEMSAFDFAAETRNC